jgi:LmbE family N-acetylglucosaminyl deacetylase
VNVFTGLPPSSAGVPWWDRLTGATNAGQRMRDRREEDRQALKLTGREATALDLLDDQYRRSALPVSAVTGRLEAALPRGTVLHAPAAMLGHPDHLLVRDAALALARAGWRLVIYADLPHAILRGWPGWVTGEADDGATGANWRRVLAAAGLDVDCLVPCVRRLDGSTRERKLRALAAYRTQRPALDRVAFAPLDDPRTLGWEVGWGVPASALGVGRRSETVSQPVIVDARREPVDDRG